MPSFDIVSKVDMQEVDNVINNTRKEILTRYDLRQGTSEVDLDRGDGTIKMVAEDRMKMKAIQDIIVSNLVRRKIDPKCLDVGEPEGTSGGHLKCEAKIRQGIDRDLARKIVKLIKDRKLKVQAAIQDDQVRVTGKKIDDLQDVIGMLKDKELEIPLQFVNMKS
ncbi:MAG: YajQ family cyclic di-GMP-binding protein [Deltaproteobacteria bacterium]|nr:YajQ family cyclic di-GMP-binding protein [Deltaproteobacteria bacterium]